MRVEDKKMAFKAYIINDYIFTKAEGLSPPFFKYRR